MQFTIYFISFLLSCLTSNWSYANGKEYVIPVPQEQVDYHNHYIENDNPHEWPSVDQSDNTDHHHSQHEDDHDRKHHNRPQLQQSADQYSNYRQDDPTKRLLSFNLICMYYEYKSDLNNPYKKCRAASIFKKFVTKDGYEIEDQSTKYFHPHFEVQCQNETGLFEMIYNNGSRRFTKFDGTRIQASPGPFPAILLPARSLYAEPHYSKSTLELEEQILKGRCFVYTGQQ